MTKRLLALLMLSSVTMAQIPPPAPESPIEFQLVEIGHAATRMESPVAYMEENGFDCSEWAECKTGEKGAGCNIELGSGELFFIQLRNRTKQGWVVETSNRYWPDE